MNQDILIELFKIEKLLKDKIVLLKSLVSTTQNALENLENSKIEDFCESLDETEQKIIQINKIDENVSSIYNSFDDNLYNEIKKIYMFFNIEKTPPVFEETTFSNKYEEIYKSIYDQYILLKEFLRLNEELKSKSELTVLTIKENLKVLNEKKQVNLKYKTMLLNITE